MIELPDVEIDPCIADRLGDKLVAAIFIIGSSWHPHKLVYPDPDAWVGFNLLAIDGELGEYIEYLNRGRKGVIDTPKRTQ